MTEGSEPLATGGGPGSVSPANGGVLAGQAPALPRWAWGLFAVLFVVHLLDSMDRWLLPAVLGGLREDLDLTDTQGGWLATVTFLSFAIWSPIIGYLADRYSRPRLLAVGIAVWSLATVATGLVRDNDQLVVARILVGVGGATFSVIALTLLMDLFPRRTRARVLASFFLAIPLGAALGLGGGAALARAVGWHTAFLIVGAPGLALAILALTLPDPVRGSSEGVDEQRLRLHERFGPSHEDYIDLMVNSSYTYSVFGLAFSMFAIAGLVYWLPAFLTVVHEIPTDRIVAWMSVTLPAAMALGMVSGGWLADRYSRINPRAGFLVPGVAMLISIPCVLLAIFGPNLAVMGLGAFVAIALMYTVTGPGYAIIANVVMPNMRGVACAVALAATHLLGDILSPAVMGWIAETFGQADSMATPFGRVLTMMGAVPRALPGHDPENLSAALLAAVPALVIAGGVMLAGARHLPREIALMLAKLRAVPARAAAFVRRSAERREQGGSQPPTTK